MTDREVMQQALDALEKTMHAWGGTCAWHRDVKLSITALKAALEQQAEPVAQSDLIKRLRDTASKGVSVWGDLQMEAAREIEILRAERECYASAMDKMLAAQPEQQAEPVALEAVYETIINWDEGGGKRSRRELAKRIVDLYTTPPQRQWVGLTDEDFLEACQIAERGNYLLALQRIQIKLKERNNG